MLPARFVNSSRHGCLYNSSILRFDGHRPAATDLQLTQPRLQQRVVDAHAQAVDFSKWRT